MLGEDYSTSNSVAASSTWRRRQTQSGLESRVERQRTLSEATLRRQPSRFPRPKISRPAPRLRRIQHLEQLSSSRTSTSLRRRRGCKLRLVTSMDSALPECRRNRILIKPERHSAWVTGSSGSVRSKMRLAARLLSRIKLSMVINSTSVSPNEVRHKKRLRAARGHETRLQRRCS